MRSKTRGAQKAQPPAASAIFVRLCLLVAVVIASYLAFTSLTGQRTIGCGPESGCDKVLDSKWAYWFGLPVSLVAIPIYLFLAFRRSGWLAQAGAMVLLGAASYFIFLQAAVIKAFCTFCLTAHVAGAIAAVLILKPAFALSARPLLVAAVMLAILVGGRFVRAPETYVVVSPQMAPNAMPAARLPSASRLVPIYAGQFQLNRDELPHWGPPNAPHVLVSLFDYTCHHCRTMHGPLLEVQRAFSNELAIISLPMPLDPTCNTNVLKTHPDHVNACEYARIGLAVWRARPSALPQFDDWLFAPERPPPLSEARSKAIELVGLMPFEQAVQSPSINEQIQLAIAIYGVAYRAGQGSMPQLIISNKVAVGTLPIQNIYQLLATELGLKVGGKTYPIGTTR